LKITFIEGLIMLNIYLGVSLIETTLDTEMYSKTKQSPYGVWNNKYILQPMIIYLHFPRNIERQSKDTRKRQSQSRKANPKTKLFRFH